MKWLDNRYKSLRKEYIHQDTLIVKQMDKDPFSQFNKWLSEAIHSGIPQPTAMTLATSDGNKVSARILLLKAFDKSGFYFFSDYQSRKGKEISKNPNAALVFFWPELERQVRIEGKITKASRELSDHYFSIRPVESRIVSIISKQSSIVASRSVLENEYKKTMRKYESERKNIKRPERWGGYCLSPSIFEFWQGGAHRLNDRIIFISFSRGWKIVRKAP